MLQVSEKMSCFRVKDQAPNRSISSQPSKGLIRRLCRLFSNLQILSYLLPKLLPWQLCLISKHQRSSNWDCPKNAVPMFNCFIHSCIIIVPRNLQFWGIPKVYLYWAHPLGLWIMVVACCIIVQHVRTDTLIVHGWKVWWRFRDLVRLTVEQRAQKISYNASLDRQI